MVEDVAMLLDGFNHVALLTGNPERFVRFYSEVFGVQAASIGSFEEIRQRLRDLNLKPC